jgi:hypothetical protein
VEVETRPKPGTPKIRVSGGGRCNVHFRRRSKRADVLHGDGLAQTRLKERARLAGQACARLRAFFAGEARDTALKVERTAKVRSR